MSRVYITRRLVYTYSKVRQKWLISSQIYRLLFLEIADCLCGGKGPEPNGLQLSPDMQEGHYTLWAKGSY